MNNNCINTVIKKLVHIKETKQRMFTFLVSLCVMSMTVVVILFSTAASNV